jgi:hypothetical protein
MNLTSDHNIQVFVASKHFLCSRLNRAIHALSCILDQLKRLFVADFCRFLSDKRDLGLTCGEKFLDVVDE